MIGLRRHDRYVLKAFWSTFGAVLLFFTVVSMVIHLAEQTAKFIRYWDRMEGMGYQPAGLIAEFYATLVPFVWLRVIPVAAALAAAFALTRLTRNHELAPLVTAGVSTRRIAWPILLSGIVIALLMLGMKATLVPALSREHMRLYRIISKAQPDRISEVPHFQDPGGARLSMAAYLPLQQRIESAILTFRDPRGRLDAFEWYPVLAWKGPRRGWVAERGGSRYPVEEGRVTNLARPIPPGAAAHLSCDANLLEVSLSKDMAMGLSPAETAALVHADPGNPHLIVMHQEQFIGPISALVLLLLGLPFSLRLAGRSAIPGIAACLAVAALYYGSGYMISSLSGGDVVNPVVLAWAPTVLFGSLGAALTLTMDG
jgi:lipopolysaccharide export system permease protein